MLRKAMRSFFEKEMGLTKKVNEARKLREEISLVELEIKLEKFKILQRNIGRQQEKVYVNDDLTNNERRIQAKVRVVAREGKF